MQIELNNYPVAVLGAGTMGEGIAQTAASAGHPVMLYDVSQQQLETAFENIAKRLERSVKKGKITAEKRDQILKKLSPRKTLGELDQAKLVIEAIIEDIAIKQEVFCKLELLLADDVILATNTSSIDLNKMSSVLKRPQHLVGMHFFNPAPIMALVEIVRSKDTASAVADTVSTLAEKWGKSPVNVRSSPGFIVNRVARPFYSEALEVLKEGGTDAAGCDTIMRDCGFFRMGPFELMDLIGLDVNYAVTCQIWESYQRHPRFAPSELQKELVDSGHLGRKSGKGFFEYGENTENAVVQNALQTSAPDSFIIEGPEHLPDSLRKLLEGSYVTAENTSGNGYIRLPEGGVIVPSNGKSSTDRSVEIGQTGLFQSLGKQVSVIKDIAGMVLTRTVAMLANEASLLVQEEVADAAGVNLAMRKGVNYPVGPLEWGEQWGWNSVVETLDNLRKLNPERYQTSEWLRQKTKLI